MAEFMEKDQQIIDLLHTGQQEQEKLRMDNHKLE